jgi:uncharacterized membrane protein YhaH (DUF805 family)
MCPMRRRIHDIQLSSVRLPYCPVPLYLFFCLCVVGVYRRDRQFMSGRVRILCVFVFVCVCVCVCLFVCVCVCVE